MAYRAVKIEHNGPKKGSGAYWGPKRDAKKESNRRRRDDSKKAARPLARFFDVGLNSDSEPDVEELIFDDPELMKKAEELATVISKTFRNKKLPSIEEQLRNLKY